MGTATRIGPSCWRFDLGVVNAYLHDGDERVLVDAGTPRTAQDLVAGLAEAGIQPASVDRVCCTHYDLDHVGGLAGLERAGLDCAVHLGEPDRSHFVGEGRPGFLGRKGAFQNLARLLLEVPDLPIRTTAEADAFGDLTTFECPGHTAGHVAYVSESAGVAYLGDLVRADDGDLRPAPTLLSRNAKQVRRSIRALGSRVPPFDVACVGHGDPLVAGGYAALRAAA